MTNGLKFHCIALAYGFVLLVGANPSFSHEAHRKAAIIESEASETGSPTHLSPPTGAVETQSESTDETVPRPTPSIETDPARAEASIPDLLGRFHPMAVHFPIALFLAAVIAEFMFAATGAEMFRHAVRFMIWGATIGALLAAPLGWLFAASGPTEEGWVLETHRWTGVGAAFFGMAVLWMCERAERTGASRIALRVTLIAQGSLVSAAGFLGGSLLYGIDHLWKGI